MLVDWSQNNAAKTTVSVYSLRARPTPTVSTPVTWDEVGATAGARRWRSPRPTCWSGSQEGDLFAPLLAAGAATGCRG